jgi:phosphoribosyl 1,2-cyclic phosphodiesterase
MDPPRLVPLAGANAQGANAYLLQAHGLRVLLDAGSVSSRPAKWTRLAHDLDAAFVSHVHGDHVGALGELLYVNPALRPVASRDSVALAPYALAGRFTALGRPDPRASARDAAASLRPVATGQPFTLAQRGGCSVTATLMPCGHVLGACSVLLDICAPESFQRIFYLPDFCLHAQPVTPGALLPTPDPARPIDLLIMEGVLGADADADAVDPHATRASLIDSLRHDRPRLLALSAIGQAPEVSAALSAAGLPHTVHELARPVFEVYARAGADLTRATFADLTGCDRALARGELVVATDEHLSPGSPSHELMARHPGADVVTMNAMRSPRPGVRHVLLPDHATRSALRAAARILDPERIALVHGAPRPLKLLARALRRDGHDVTVPSNLQAVLIQR